MLFLTLHDSPGGIYKSQVIDVAQLFRDVLGADIRVASFLSIRRFMESRTWIRERESDSLVLPMVPKLSNWRRNAGLLRLFCGDTQMDTVIARGVLATNLALDLRERGTVQTVVYDGRGAIAAEAAEYKVFPDPVDKQIPMLERRAVVESDHRIAVTEKLTDYWQQRYGYRKGQETIIPCTLSTDFESSSSQRPDENRAAIRDSLGWSNDAIVIVYSGSTSGWQSFSLVADWLRIQMVNPDVHALFLTQDDPLIVELAAQFPTRVCRRWLRHEEILPHLRAADHGIMLREDSVTNRVASPTKFAEYLVAGLEVLSSPHIGDYPKFIERNACGRVINDLTERLTLGQATAARRRELTQLGLRFFSKNSDHVQGLYRSLLESIDAAGVVSECDERQVA
jgi:hypothetical protein